jgi:hypothetical protein
MPEKPTKDQTPEITAIEPVPMVSPSPTFYSELATTLITAIDQFTSSVPDFNNPIVTEDFVTKKRRIRPEFVTEAVSALLVHSELHNIKQLNAVEALDDKQYVDAFIPLARHIKGALKGLGFSISARQARLAGNAQLIYSVAKAIARDRNTTLGVHVDDMKRSLATSTRRKKVIDEPAGGVGTAQPGGKEVTTTTKTEQQ